MGIDKTFADRSVLDRVRRLDPAEFAAVECDTLADGTLVKVKLEGKMKFEGVCLLTTDVPRLAEFYSTVFAAEAEGDDRHSVIQIGGLGLALWHPEGLEQRIASYPPNVRRNCYSLMFSVADLDTEYERLKKLNVEFTELPSLQPWGAKSFAFVDPDGNNLDVHMVLAR